MHKQTTSNPLLPCVVRELTFGTDNEVLVDNLSLDLQHDGVTAIIGPNGAGKSLLLRLLHGLITAETGDIRWGGRLMSGEIRMAQAMVFQRPVLLRRSTRENVAFALRQRGQSTSQRLNEALQQVGLEHLSGRPARLLSGGEQQRLALARALALKPDVLFLDEPTANLDPSAIASIESILRKASDNNTKLVLVTHDMGQAKRLADDVVFMHRGQVGEHTVANEFFQQPKTEIARRFIAGELITEYM